MSDATLHPIDASLVPFQVGEKVAFTENHSDHPGLYGAIETIGINDAGELRFVVVVIDPFTGDHAGDKHIIYEAGMEDIQ